MKVTWAHVPGMLIAMYVTARTLALVAGILRPYLRIDYDAWFELAMVGGQFLVQWAVLWRKTWRVRADYAGVLVLVSAIGAMLLWPLLILNRMAPVTPIVGLVFFFGVVAAIFAIHVIFVTRLELPKVLCVTWLLYRFAILLFVVKF